MGVVGGVNGDKLIGFRVVVTELHIVTVFGQNIERDILGSRIIVVCGVQSDRILGPGWIVLLAAGANLLGHPDSAVLIHHGVVRAVHPFLVFARVRLLFFRAVVVVLGQGETM